MKTNLKLRFAVAAASGVMLSGAAFAGAPIAFDQFTATAGVITDTSTECGTTFNCVTLDASGVGMLMQQVTDTGTGVAYLRTINVEADAEGAASALAFSNEVYVYSAGVNANNVALRQRVGDGAPTGMAMTVDLYENNFRTDGTLSDPGATGSGAGAQMLLVQNIGTNTSFQQQGVNSNVQQRIDQNMGSSAGRFAYGVVAGNGTGLFEPTDAGSLGGTDMPALAYAAGDALSVVWLASNMPGGGAAGEFGYQAFRNYGTATGATVLAGTAVVVDSVDLLSNEVVPGSAGYAFTSNGPWDWPVDLFGTAPTPP